MGEQQAGADALGMEVRVLPEDGLGDISSRQHGQQMLHRDARAADDGLAAENVAADGDAVE